VYKYMQLSSRYVLDTIGRLEVRIADRFPNSGLRMVCAELFEFAGKSREDIHWIAKPHLLIRFTIFIAITVALGAGFYLVNTIKVNTDTPSVADFVQLIEALTNEVLLLGAALFFLISLESRLKRAKALKALHHLRSLAHVIDMHQLTKDPTMLDSAKAVTTSPKRELSGFQLKRYLDYCSEMLSLIGKIAALYSERLPDTEIVAAASDIEELCTSMSRKIWQKIADIDN